MRRCFQCGALTDVAALTRVGDGEFCATCFRALLAVGADTADGGAREEDASPNARAGADARAGSTAAARAAPPATHARPGATPRARLPAPARSTCLVCDCDLTDAPAVVFLGGEICGPCSAEMAAELESAHAAPSTEPSVDAEAGRAARAEGAASAAGTGDPLASPSEPGAALPFTPGTGVVACAGCERPMPGPGSYRVLRGKPYCAACVPFFARLPAAVYEAPASSGLPSGNSLPPSSPASSSPASASPSSSPLARPGQCDCCRRALDPDAEPREGFELCSACLTSDAELALSVARARHRRALARLRSKLEGER
jgi:hypothetical protein